MADLRAAALLIALLAAPQLAAGQTPPLAPPPDPRAWWDNKAPRVEDRLDPLGDRRATKAEATAPRALPAAPDPLLYRLWGLAPLQTQLVRSGEAVLEAWVRPSGGVRQMLVRVTVRADGRAFVQARAGLGCCRPQIDRRVDIDAELPPGAGARFVALARDPVWSQPLDARVEEKGAGAVEGVCVNGVGYEVALVSANDARRLRRNCDDAAIGSIVAVLAPLIGAALGHDARFDVLFAHGADFSAQSQAYRDLVAAGGRLAPASAR